jgi:hypothetical protein
MSRRRRPRRAASYTFSYRCPLWLIAAVDEARWTLREPSRTALVTRAIAEFLQKRNLYHPPASATTAPAPPAPAATDAVTG